jgi:hypothetical protein
MLAKAAESGELMAVEQTDEVLKNTDVEEVITEVVDPEVVVEPIEPIAEPVVEETPAGDPEVEQAAELLNTAKSFVSTLNKFDQATFDRARTELANLISIEAGEMAEGSNESYSISQLLEAVHHLFAWYEGEVAEGEVESPVVSESSELKEDSEMSAKDASEDKMCDKCGKALDDEGKCDKCSKDADAEMSADKSATIDFNEDQIVSIVEKAVAQAKASVTEEITLLKSALEAEQLEKSRIADELVTAKKAVAPTGPRRTGGATPDITNNALLQKAAEYSLKASQTLDPILAKGYKELAEEARQQANS